MGILACFFSPLRWPGAFDTPRSRLLHSKGLRAKTSPFWFKPAVPPQAPQIRAVEVSKTRPAMRSNLASKAVEPGQSPKIASLASAHFLRETKSDAPD